MRCALVTGGNRGLGLETCRQLAALNWAVWLAARDESAAEAAARSLSTGETARVRGVALDVADRGSCARLASQLQSEGVRLDALVNNAGAMFRGIDEQIARETLDVNYRGPVRVTDALLPLLSPTASVVMVSSGMGELSGFRADLRARLSAPGLDRAELEALAGACVRGVVDGNLAELGFPRNVYSVSKALLNGFTRVLSREWEGDARRVNAVCPGWVQTRMGGKSAPRSLEQGARGIVWAATLDASGPSGGFFRDGGAIPW